MLIVAAATACDFIASRKRDRASRLMARKPGARMRPPALEAGKIRAIEFHSIALRDMLDMAAPSANKTP